MGKIIGRPKLMRISDPMMSSGMYSTITSEEVATTTELRKTSDELRKEMQEWQKEMANKMASQNAALCSVRMGSTDYKDEIARETSSSSPHKKIRLTCGKTEIDSSEFSPIFAVFAERPLLGEKIKTVKGDVYKIIDIIVAPFEHDSSTVVYDYILKKVPSGSTQKKSSNSSTTKKKK